MPMSHPSDSEKAGEPVDKRKPRHSRLVKAGLHSARFGSIPVTIRNVSATGIGGTAPVALTIGERIRVDLPGQKPMMGSVRWVTEDRFGIETDDCIHFEAFRAAQGGHLPSSDSTIEFRIIPPPVVDTRRPLISYGGIKDDRPTSDWHSD